MRGRAFAKFLIETVHKRLPPYVGHFIVIHPADYNASARFLEPWLDENTHRDVSPDHIGTLRPYGTEGPHPGGHVLYMSPKCPKGHVFVTLLAPDAMAYSGITVLRGSRMPLTPVRWNWNDLDEVHRQWPLLAPEYAALVYPPPPQALTLKASEKALLARAIDRPALTHWKSAALRAIVARSYARPLPEMGQGWYRTTELGCRALKVWKSSWARLLDDG